MNLRVIISCFDLNTATVCLSSVKRGDLRVAGTNSSNTRDRGDRTKIRKESAN